MRFKTLRGSPEGKAQRRQYLLVMSLDCYKWYQIWTPGDVPERRLSPEWGWRQDSVPTRTLDPEGGVDGGSHIDWRSEQVLARTLGLKGGEL